MRNSNKLLKISTFVALAVMITQLGLLAETLKPSDDKGIKPPASNRKYFPMASEELLKPASKWPKADFVIVSNIGKGMHLGPTGLWGTPMGQNVIVKTVDSNSPADGKVKPGDVIYGANGKEFSSDRKVLHSFSLAITEAETSEAGGKLVLDISRDGELIKVPVQLKVMGAFSATSPYNCEKSENIIARAEEYMRKGLRPESGLPDDKKYMYAPFNDSVLFLMASGKPELQGLVRRHILNCIKELENWKAGTLGRGNSFPHSGWSVDYMKLLFGEYYHHTGDTTVLPYLEAIVNGTFKDGTSKVRNWSWPPKEPTGYGTHPHAHMAGTMGAVLAKEAGLKINEERLQFDLKYLYHKRAEYGHVGYHGYGPKPIEKRQTDQPEVISPEEKSTGTFSAKNGKPAMAAALFSMLDGYEKGVHHCSERSVYAYSVTHKGHGGIWFNGFWTPIGASHAGPEKFQFFMKKQQWWRELYRDHTGSMWQEGNAKMKKDTLGTGFAIHRAIPRKKLRMFGAPRSMFAPTAPAYMKEALAAHRNRDYALAEKLTLKLQATVPEKDKQRVNHFLNTVKMLKQSVEHDLTFTESILAKGNYTLASIEHSQLKMVVAPKNPRFIKIAKTLEANKDKIRIEELKNEMGATRRKINGEAKENMKTNFTKTKANTVTLLKDSPKYAVPGMRKGTYHAIFSKEEWTKCRMLQLKQSEDAPAGWQQPDFDDSKWKETTMAAKWREQFDACLRANFELEDVKAFKTLRIRGYARSQANMTIYLNGKVIAMAAEVPGSMTFDLKPSAFGLLRKGKNTLAVSSQRGYGKHGFSIRLEGILGERPESASKSTIQKKNVRKTSVEKKSALNHHDEIALMLANLKKSKAMIAIGSKKYTSIKVHEYLYKLYRKHKSKVTSTDIFLNKLATKTTKGAVYYVINDKGGKVMLKDWLKAAKTGK